MTGRKLFSPVSFIRLRMVALAPLFLVCRWRYTPYPAKQQKNIKEKTKLNTIPLIWFTFCSRYFWNSTTFRRPGRDSQILFPQIWIGTLWMSPNLEAGVRNSLTCILSKKNRGFSNSVADPWHFGTDPDPRYPYLWLTGPRIGSGSDSESGSGSKQVHYSYFHYS